MGENPRFGKGLLRGARAGYRATMVTCRGGCCSCVVGLVVGLAAWSIATGSPAFSFVGTSWVDQVALARCRVEPGRRRRRVLDDDGRATPLRRCWSAPASPGSSPSSTALAPARHWCSPPDCSSPRRARQLSTWVMFCYPSGRISAAGERAWPSPRSSPRSFSASFRRCGCNRPAWVAASCAENLVAVWDDPRAVADITRVGLGGASHSPRSSRWRSELAAVAVEPGPPPARRSGRRPGVGLPGGGGVDLRAQHRTRLRRHRRR